MSATPAMAVWVHAETMGEGLAGGAAAVLAQARLLSPDVTAFCVDPGARLAAAALGRWGARRVVAVAAPDGALAGPWVAATMAEAATEEAVAAGGGPEVVLFPMTPDGSEAAGRLSARLDQPVLAGDAIEVVDGRISVETSITDGDVATVVRSTFTGPGPYLVVIGGAPPGEPTHMNGNIGIEEVTPEPPLGTAGAEVVAVHHDTVADVGLGEAAVVVAGGRGLGSAERFDQLAELARLLGGALAATSAAVDEGWALQAHLVGQTGFSVRPEVYLAFGISGAPYHLAGATGARHIVAVNNDPNAPIFDVADIGVVGDAGDVVARLVVNLRARGNRTGGSGAAGRRSEEPANAGEQ